MTTFVDFLTSNGFPLIVVSAIILGLGSLTMILHRSPAHRQRIGEVSIAATLAFVVLSLLPLPRTGIGSWLAAFDAEDFQPVAMDMSSGNTRLTLSQRDVPTVNSQANMFGPPISSDVPPLVRPENQQADTANNGPAPLVAAKLGPHDTATTAPNPNSRVLSQFADSQQEPTAGDTPAMDANNHGDLATIAGPQPSEAEFASVPTASATTGALLAIPSQETVAWIFLCGSAVCCVWLLFGRVQLWRLTRFATPAGDHAVSIAQDCLSASARKRTRVLISEKCLRPVTYGIWRPTIILPSSLIRRSSTAALAHVLRHECAHINRRDAIGQMVSNLALPICWLHPLYWLIRFRIRLDAELMADDWAAGQSSTVEYVEQLVQLVRRRRGLRLAGVGGLGLFGSQSQFSRRMEMLMKRSTRLPARCSSLWKGALLAVFCGAALVAADAVGGRQAAAQQNDKQSRAEMRDRLAQLQDIVSKLEEQAVEAMTFAKHQAARADAAEQKLQEMADRMEQLTKHGIDAAKIAAHDAQREADMTAQRLVQLDQAAAHYAEQIEDLQNVVSQLQQENAVLRNELESTKAQADGPPDPFGNTARNDNPFGSGKSEEATSDPFGADSSKDLSKARNSSPFAGGHRLGSSGPDILELATALAEGHGNLRKAEIHLMHLRQASESGAVPASEVQLAEIELETQHNKLELYRSLAEATLDAAKSDLENLHQQMQHTAQLAEKGYVTDSELRLAQTQVAQAEAHVQVIKRLLSQ